VVNHSHEIVFYFLYFGTPGADAINISGLLVLEVRALNPKKVRKFLKIECYKN